MKQTSTTNKTKISLFLDMMKASKRIKIAIAVIFYIFAFMITVVASMPQRYDFQVGDIATEDIVAPKKITDTELTNKLKQQSASQTPNVYDYIPSCKKNTLKNIDTLFAKVNKLEKNYKKSDTKIINSQCEITLTDKTYKTLTSLSAKERKALKKDLSSYLKKLYSNEIKSDEMSKTYNKISNHYRNSSYSTEKSDALIDIAKHALKANMVLNETATKQAKEDVMNAVEEIVYEPGEKIISKGDTITANQISVLQQGGMIREGFLDEINNMAGAAIMLLFLLVIYGFYLKVFHPEVFNNNKLLALIATQVFLMIILAHLANMVNVYLIPMAIMSMTICVLISPRIAINTNVFITLYLGMSMEMSIQELVFILLSGFVGIIFMQSINRRSDVYKAAAMVSLTNVVIVFIFAVFLNTFGITILQNMGYAAANGIISGMVALGMMLFWEYAFSLLTPFTLMELASPTNELMRKMINGAPGTYHHCLLVGNLAQEACDEIGANGLLARVGAFYHDIGKMQKPLFFSENQGEGNNPHDHLDPNVSVRIIKSHVSDGVYLGEKYGLPEEIIEFIQTHHGNSIIKFFYMKEKEKGIEPDLNTYSYDGPTPSTVETTVVLLADSVEAAVRSMKTDNPERIERMIDKIVKSKIADRQLINSPLKIKDIEAVKRAFLRVLTGVYHERVKYPGQKDGGEE